MNQLNEQQLTHYKVQLNQNMAEIRTSISIIFDQSSHASHRLLVNNLDKMSTDDLIEFTLKLDNPSLKKAIEQLKKIDASLISIELGMFGLCSDCESELTIDALNEAPTTQRCSICEAKYQKQKYNNYRL